MAKRCPYTTGKVYKESLSGKLVEVDPEKNDNVFEIGEEVAVQITYHNHQTHTSKPKMGVQITYKEHGKKATIVSTDSKGWARYVPQIEGYLAFSWYDPYIKQAHVSTIKVVPPLPEPKPEPKPELKPDEKPVGGDGRLDALIKFFERILVVLRMKRKNES